MRRGSGECPILAEEGDLFAASRDCYHNFGALALRSHIETRLKSGPFPIRCPTCALDVTNERGIITRSAIKGLQEAGVIPSVLLAQRLLLQQVRHITDERSVDLQYSMSKPCPNCSMPIAHYKGHGCHHIAPRAGTNGCPSCHHHFCYVCLWCAGPTWSSCPNGCPTFCTEDCDCPPCLDCTPGVSCDLCDGPNGRCQMCKRA